MLDRLFYRGICTALVLACIGLLYLSVKAAYGQHIGGPLIEHGGTDSTPLSCDGKSARFHQHRAKRIIAIAHDSSRFLDATPAKSHEKFAWRSHKLCVLDRGRRHRIGEYVDRKQDQFDAYFEDILYPPGRSTLEAIAACESGGDPEAINPAGYYGKYQFDLETWASVGGSGNPTEAPEREQDYRASVLYERRGAAPWPVCGQ